MQFLCCWRLRNQHELDAVIEELSALLPKEQLCRLYEQATREPYSFLFVYYLKPRNEMFYKRFEERFALEKRRRWERRCKRILSQYMTAPTEGSFKLLKHLISYLWGVRRHVLGFLPLPLAHRHGVSKAVSEAVSDADWSGDRTSRRSSSSGNILLNGQLLYLSARKSSCSFIWRE